MESLKPFYENITWPEAPTGATPGPETFSETILQTRWLRDCRQRRVQAAQTSLLGT